MRLSELITGTEVDMTQEALNLDIEIGGLTSDSRKVAAGDLFAALPGTTTDGTKFIEEALGKGAKAVLTGHQAKLSPSKAEAEIAHLVSDNPRRSFALMAARLYADQPATIAAITGTNGKTSVAAFTRQIWAKMDIRAASLGTLGLVTSPPSDSLDTGETLTTPDPVFLHATLADLKGRDFDHLVMEASSHGLDQYRLDGVRVGIAGFTNLSRDHIDYHGDMAHYLQAKQRLFLNILSQGGTAVLNADTPQIDTLIETCREKGHRVLTFGHNGDDIRIEKTIPHAAGQIVELTVCGKSFKTDIPFLGDFQVSNILCALGFVIAAGGDVEKAVSALPHLSGAPGRMQCIAHRANGAPVYVDYAHTPDALENVLHALRPHTKGRLWLVFGCGGDRDVGKRPLMGDIASRLADIVIVTDDNPRNEAPDQIRRQIFAGILPQTHATVRETGDRAAAIAEAVEGLAADDLLVIAGKGHETYQLIEGERHSFDDAQEARRAVKLLENRE